MQIIEGYILRRALTAFLVTLFWTLAAVWTTQVVGRVNLVTDTGQSAFAFLQLATLMLPAVVSVVVPFAIIIAVAHTLTVMNTDSELAVINASGSSRLVVIKPIILLAVFAGVLSFAVDNAVDPYSRQKVREMVAAARADLLSRIIQEGSFHEVDQGLYVQIGERQPDGRLGSIFVSDSRAEDVDLIYYAKSGIVAGGASDSLLIMNDGVVHRKSPSGELSVIRFNSYAFDLAAFAPATRSVRLLPKDRTLTYLMNPDPDDKIFQGNPQAYRGELHVRFTEWLYSIVFALIALAVAGDARSHREARAHPMVTALTIALLVRWIGFFVSNEVETSAGFTPLVYGVPLAAAGVSVWFILANRTMELPSAVTDRVVDLFQRMTERAAEWRLPRGGSLSLAFKRRG